jgi:hypothetical protein
MSAERSRLNCHVERSETSRSTSVGARSIDNPRFFAFAQNDRDG